MERKQFLELCQKHAVGQDVKVFYRDIPYRPCKYELSFDKQGKSKHTAIIKDMQANSFIYAKLEDIKEEVNHE